MKKYELTNISKEYNGVTLYRLKSLVDFNDVKAGDLGGWVENEHNVSQRGDCWVYGDSSMHGNSSMHDNSSMHGVSVLSGSGVLRGNINVYSGCIFAIDGITIASEWGASFNNEVVSIGCEDNTVEGWVEFFENSNEKFATCRNTEDFANIYAHFYSLVEFKNRKELYMKRINKEVVNEKAD